MKCLNWSLLDSFMRGLVFGGLGSLLVESSLSDVLSQVENWIRDFYGE